MLKVGDIVECKSNTFYSYCIDVSVGKTYKIMNITSFGEYREFAIIDDKGELHGFSFSVYDRWFYTEKELRKKKLERFGNV